MMFGAENYRNTINCGFIQVVYSRTEPTAYNGSVTIPVKAAKQSETINYKVFDR